MINNRPIYSAYASDMQSQRVGGEPKEYVFSRDLIKRIRVFLLNTDDDDIEAEFFLDQVKLTDDPVISIEANIASHLHDYLYGATK